MGDIAGAVISIAGCGFRIADCGIGELVLDGGGGMGVIYWDE